MLSREEAITLFKKYIRDEYFIKRALLSEAILRNLANVLNKDEKLWALTGFLHNIDYEYSQGNPEDRGILSEKLLSGLVPEETINAIRANNYIYTNYAPVTALDKSLIATTEITDLMFEIIKNTQDKNQKVIDIPEIFDKYKNRDFASKIKRKRIKIIEDVGIKLEDFIKITLKSVIEIKDELGL